MIATTSLGVTRETEMGKEIPSVVIKHAYASTTHRIQFPKAGVLEY